VQAGKHRTKPISCSKMASGLICHGGFEPHAWGVASLMDVTVLVVASLLVWLLVNRENHYARGIPQDVQVLHKKAHH